MHTNIQNVCPVMNLLSFGVRTMNKFSENKTLDFGNHVAY